MKTDFALLPLTQTARHANYMGPSSVRHTLDDRRATLHTHRHINPGMFSDAIQSWIIKLLQPGC